MENLITDEMILEFNNILKNEGSIIILKRNDDGRTVQFIINDKNIESFIINLNDSFYEKLEKFFREKGITDLRYNNSGSCFWKYN